MSNTTTYTHPVKIKLFREGDDFFLLVNRQRVRICIERDYYGFATGITGFSVSSLYLKPHENKSLLKWFDDNKGKFCTYLQMEPFERLHDNRNFTIEDFHQLLSLEFLTPEEKVLIQQKMKQKFSTK